MTEESADSPGRWVDYLSDEDLAFLKRFLVSSGSLKETAEAYGVSYPTVRLRLDRLIERIRVYDDDRPMGRFERTARGLVADGRLDPSTLRTLLEAHRKEAGRKP